MKKLLVILTMVIMTSSCVTLNQILDGIEKAGQYSEQANEALEGIKGSVESDFNEEE